MKRRLLPVLVALTAISIFSKAQAEEEANFRTSPKPDYNAADRLGSQHEDISMTSDIEAADAVAYKGVENDAKIEASNLKKDIKRLEAQIQNLKVGAEQAKKSAELAQKKTDLVRNENIAARKRVKAAMLVKDKAEKEKAAEEAKLNAVNNEAAAIAEENRKIDEFVKLAREDRAKIMERATAVRAEIAAAKQRAIVNAEKAKQMKEQNKQMDAKVSKAEAKMAEARGPSSAGQ